MENCLDYQIVSIARQFVVAFLLSFLLSLVVVPLQLGYATYPLEIASFAP
ncbi:hypothetical protein Hanom_Chr10g00894751 [Helianthus anomalus]